MKAQQGSQFMAGGSLQSQNRPSGAADPINIGPGLLQSLQSLTQTQNLAPQQVFPISLTHHVPTLVSGDVQQHPERPFGPWMSYD